MVVCEDPEILSYIYIFKTLLNVGLILSGVILVIMVSIDIIKIISSSDVDYKKGAKNIKNRFIAIIMIFIVPSIVSFVLNVVSNNLEYGNCFDNANREYIEIAFINKAEEYVLLAEKNLSNSEITNAKKYINKIENKSIKEKLLKRIEVVEKYILAKQAEKNNSVSNNNLSVEGLYASGDCNPPANIEVLDKEPNPSCPINYWANQGKINKENFIYPKDDNGKSLGAWPKNYKTISDKIQVKKTYQNGLLMWPITPQNGKYTYVYEHNGIDILAPIGTPVYSPVDGILVYSVWGNTKNKGSDETAYSIYIRMDNPIIYNNKKYQDIFLTHLSGIIYRCSSATNCNKKITKGELLGFVGNAAGTAETGGYAPHLHMTIYPIGNYSAGLKTSIIEKIYSIKNGTNRKAGE